MARSSRVRYLLLAALALAARDSAAQTVSTIAGTTMTITFGQKQGVAAGMTGRICADEEVGGRRVEICGAKFTITAVREATATATITGGDPGEVAQGHRVAFEKKLGTSAAPAPPAPLTPVPPRAATPEDLLARGNHLFDVQDWEGAAAAFKELLLRFPGHPDSAYAESLLAACDRRTAAAAEETAQAAAAARASDQAAELALRAKQLLAAEQWAEAKELAERALALDPSHSEAEDAKRVAETRLAPPDELIEPLSGIMFVLIPEGRFTMGCTAGDMECGDSERPAHVVNISQPFYLAERETTVEKYSSCVESGQCRKPDCKQKQPDLPVDCVAWEDARSFCEWAGGRLPTEAEWELAARGGESEWRYPWGSSITRQVANYGGSGKRGTFGRSAPTGMFEPNGYGLFDMAGNVWEWVADWMDETYYGQSAPADPKGPSLGTQRVVRGGSWADSPIWLRVSSRFGYPPAARYYHLGFRCARAVGS